MTQPPSAPLIIHHRRNSLAELAATPPEYGVEVDIRSYGSDLIIAHDPFVPGLSFADWASHYRHRLAIFNVKEEGLESKILDIASVHGIEDFFFLDQSMPFLVKTVLSGERRCAVRVSEFESVFTALNLAPHADWVWIDTFTRLPIDAQAATRLRESGLKLCLVSPDLLGRDRNSDFLAIQTELAQQRISLDAVCTKQPSRWATWQNPGA